MEVAKVIWFTGLSGSGKSTLSSHLHSLLKKKKYKILTVDGDKFRKKKNYKNKFNIENIKKNNTLVIKYIAKNTLSYDFILVSVIAPFTETRKFAKKKFGKRYFEIYVHCSINTLKKRDTKGLYKKADKKIIKNLIGYKSKIKYQKSKYKVININTDKQNIKQSTKIILQKIFN